MCDREKECMLIKICMCEHFSIRSQLTVSTMTEHLQNAWVLAFHKFFMWAKCTHTTHLKRLGANLFAGAEILGGVDSSQIHQCTRRRNGERGRGGDAGFPSSNQ